MFIIINVIIEFLYLTDSMLVRVLLEISKYPHAFIGLKDFTVSKRNFNCCLSLFSKVIKRFSWIFILTTWRDSYAESKGCLPKKNCWEGDIGPYGRKGAQKNSLFLISINILMGVRGQIFWSHVPCSFLCFCLHTICCISWGKSNPLLWEVCKK